MGKLRHEFRDPIHNFIYVNNDERKVIDSKFFQRLRYIHQLALTYLVYPGASHKRFEHSLGVMELASKVFDVIFDIVNYKKSSLKIPEGIIMDEDDRLSIRRTLRYAALCHDIGHLPFSHAAEKEVFPKGQDHETITYDIITKYMADVWDSLGKKIDPFQVAKIAVGPGKIISIKEHDSLSFSTSDLILSQIITGDAFGVDRMDYLIRDSYHIGVAYGKFDYYRLIDCIRLCMYSPDESSDDKLNLGLEEGGLNSAEAMMLARYYMFNQVYYHRIRRIYDYHLKKFFLTWIESTGLNTNNPLNDLMSLTDNDVLHSMNACIKNKNKKMLKIMAERVIYRKHFKDVYTLTEQDIELSPTLNLDIEEKLQKSFPKDLVCLIRADKKPGNCFFPVIKTNGKIESSINISSVLRNIPTIKLDTIYADESIALDVKLWIDRYINELTKRRKK